MKNRFYNRTLEWKYYFGALLLLLLIAAPARVKAQQFTDVTVTWVGIGFNEQCCTDQGVECGFDITAPFITGDPDPRFALRSRILPNAFPGFNVQTPDNVSCPFNGSINVPQFTQSDFCGGGNIDIQTQSWEEDGVTCGSNTTYDVGCFAGVEDDDAFQATNFSYNYQALVPQGVATNRDFFSGSRRFTLQILWNAAGPPAPLVGPAAPACLGSSTTLTVTSALSDPGNEFRWYSNAALTTQVGTGPVFNTPPLGGNTSYWVAEVDPILGCKGASNRVDLVPMTGSGNATAADVTICEGESVTLVATGDPGATFTWYDDAGLTHAVQVGAEYITPVLTTTTSFWVTQQIGTNCPGPADEVVVNVNPKPNPPFGDDSNPACFDEGATLHAVSDPGTTIEWYADASALNLLGTGPVFTTLELTQPTYFYILARDNQTGCVSDVVAILAEVTPKFEQPAVSDVDICQDATDITIRAHISYPRDLIVDFVDFNSFLSATVRFVGNDATLPLVIFGDVPSNLDPQNNVWDADVEITIPIIGGGWDYSAPGTYSIGARVINTWQGGLSTFSCTSDYGNATLTVTATPAAPTATGGVICEGQSANLVATGEAGATFTWYDEVGLTHAIQVGAEYTTPPLSANTSYWVTQTVNGCASPATEVIVTVNPAADMPFGTSGYTICLGQTVPPGEGLEATCSNAGGGGNATTPIVGTGAFPIAVGPNAGVGGTVSFDASAIPAGSTITKVTVNANLIHTFIADLDIWVTSPSATQVYVHSANGGNDNFGTGGPPPTSAATYTWDDAGPLGPIAITTGDNNVPVGTYFPSPDALAGFIGEDPNGAWTLDIMDFANLDGGFLNSSTLTITYNLPASAGSLTWWDSETGGIQVGSGSPFLPPGYAALPPGAYVFWAQCDDASACTNRRVPVTFTVLPAIAAPIVRGDDEVCEGNSATLTVANPSTTVEWYTDPALSVLVHTGATYTTPELSTTVTYYVVNNNGTCRSAATTWTVTVDPAPLQPDVFTDIFATDEFGNLAICEDQAINLDIILDDPANQLAFIFSESEPEDLNSDWLFFTDEFIELNTMSDMIYYVRALDLNTGCWSKAVPIYINVYDRPNPAQVRGATVCVGEDATVYADVSIFFDNTGPNTQNTVYWTDEDGFFIEIHPIPLTPPGPPYIFNDSLNLGSFATPGTYNFFVTTSNDFCYSVPQIVTVTVLALPESPVVEDQEVCEGEDIVLTASCSGDIRWYSDAALTDLLFIGSQFPVVGATATTTYYVTCRNGDCESLPATLTLTVNPKPEAPEPEFPFYVICYDDNGELFASNTAGDPIAWYDDPEGLIEWTTPNDGTFTTPELTQPAIFYVAAIDAVTGCRSDIVPVQVFTTPKFEHPRVEDVEVCANGDSVTLKAHISFPRDLVIDNFDFFTFSNAIVRFVDTDSSLNIFGDVPVALDPFNDIWEGEATLTIPAVDPGGTYDYTVPGTYDIGARTANFWFNVFTGELFECSSDYGTGTITVLPAPATPTVGNTGPVCVGEDVTIFTTPLPGGIYNWTGPNGFTSNAQSFTFFNVTLAQAGDYTVRVTDLNGCQSDSATTTVVVNPLPTVDSVYSNSPLCEHETLNLFIDVDPLLPYSYLWSGPNGFSSTLEDPSIPDVTEADNQGFYSVRITDNVTGCDTFVVILVQIDAFPDKIIADNDGPVCEGATIHLNASNVFSAVTYHWTGPLGFDAMGQHQTLTNVTQNMSGIYTVVVTLPGGCQDSATTEVIINPNPIADAGEDDTTFQDDPIVLHGSGGFTYQWVPNTYLDHDNIPNPIFNSPDVGVFPIELTVWDDNHGCSDKDTVIIVVLPKLDLAIPDLITPNADGINDAWVIKYLVNITDPYTLDVYARGGAKVFSTTAYNNDWTGTYKDKELPDGGYWFVLAIEGGKTYKGSLTIKR